MDSCPVSGYGVTFLRRNDGVGVTLAVRGRFETCPYECRLSRGIFSEESLMQPCRLHTEG